MINPFKKTYSDSELKLFRFLSRIQLFNKLSDDELAEFTPYLHSRKYKMDEAVFFRDDPSQALYIVKRGMVCLNLEIEDRFEVISEVKASQAFGDNSLLEDTYRLYTAIVTSETAELMVIPQVNILEIFEDNHIIKSKMLEAVAVLYNNYTANLFKAYQSSYGFFNIGEAYRRK
ncbi:cyclic nucleotide-binding domain-containing protein [Fulvivirgaceae bacterium BMA10]|uniref:Cyclic nucleotide-binding domain-containing protein n=1 Tax=Splendidivirga corallicola TaxID=3051826 RepID=A0ABT8KJ59_9BACT|nr:cyclic nucleotide-binding domain-containing protein [Fulvivirgaceae bacterium BMA10]